MKTYHKDEDGNILMHSDVYLGEDYISNNLCHWKYLKKVKSPSGKWRYIYDDSEMRLEGKIHDDVERKINSSEGYEFETKDGATHWIKGDYHSTTRSLFSEPGKQSQKDKIKQKRYETYKKYKLKKLKDFPKRTISRGIGAINKLLLNIEKSWIK